MHIKIFLTSLDNPASEQKIYALEEKYKISIPRSFKDILYFSNVSSVINTYIKAGNTTSAFVNYFFQLRK